MATEFHTRIYDALSREYVGEFPFYDCSFNTPLGEAGEWTGTLALEEVDRETIRHLKRALNYESAWIFVYWGATIPWHGKLVAAPWNRAEGTLAAKAAGTRSWLDQVMVGRGRDVRHSWKNMEQCQITRNLVGMVATGAGGRLKIHPDARVSGIRRDLLIEPQSYGVVGELIDNLADGENGFEWDVLARDSAADGRPEFYLGQWYPERASPGAPRHLLADTGEHANILNDPGWPEDASGRRSMIHALGDGEAPAMVTAVDYDPLLDTGRVLLTEKTSSYSGQGVTTARELAGLAHAEREQLSGTLSTLTVAVALDDPVYGSWQTGDRFRLVLRDEWLDTDLSAVRCVDHSVHYAQSDGQDLVSLELDMADSLAYSRNLVG